MASAERVGREQAAPEAPAAPKVPADCAASCAGVCTEGRCLTEGSGGRVVKVGKRGGVPVTLATGQAGPCTIAVAGGTVYWANGWGRTVMSVATTGGTPTVVASAGAGQSALGIDSTSAYWQDGRTGVKKTSHGRSLASVSRVFCLDTGHAAVDDTKAYWATQVGDTVCSRPHPFTAVSTWSLCAWGNLRMDPRTRSSRSPRSPSMIRPCK